jgi:Asp-tRNA(Asn)/Glu-tRNA(Gln) amidotransferase A subunit family amidase
VYGESSADLPWRFVVPDEILASVEPATRDAFDALIGTLAAAPDAPSVETAALGDLDAAAAAFRAVQGAEAWRNNGEWLRAHPGAVGPAAAERFRAGSAVTAAAEASARAALMPLRERLAALVGGAVLLFPTVPGPAPARTADPAGIDGVRAATLRMTAPVAIGGLPAVSVPLLTAPSPLGTAPVGVCLVSRAGTDIALVRLARRLAAIQETS